VDYKGGKPRAVVGRYWVQTFGCQMNLHDSERMEEVLVRHGWDGAASIDEADLIVLNTCSVRDKAEQKLRSEVGRLGLRKKERPDLIIAVAGCVAQQEGEKLLSRVPHIDLVLGPDNLGELPALVELQRAGAVPVARTVFDLDAPRFLSAAPSLLGGRAPVSAFVTTMKGCDERCSFCVVPYTRGPERYRPAAEIVDEVQRLVTGGAREVVLLGQTVDSYRDASLPAPESDDPDESQFPALLRLLSRETPHYDPLRPSAPGLARIRYTSPHPRHATLSLARVHAELDLLARHVHLPVQSGSDRMLKRMIRRYTRAEYVTRARRLHAARPGLTMSTDIIVGFPGETREDFDTTLSLVREVGFVSLFGFKFSPRPHTPALKLADDVPEEEKSERLARLFELSESLGRAHLETLVGTEATVLLEGPSKSPGQTPRLTGRTERNEIVHVAEIAGRRAEGAMVTVKITRAFKHSLEGELLESSARALPMRAVNDAPVRKRELPVVI
jgi:tRNA-2-methylthio-N6-dimethylallyladenosine synthase